jgi:hypothetical protein
MARTAVTAQTPKGPYPGTISANLLDITFTAADASNANTTAWIGNRMLVVARNSGAGARTLTISSIADSHGRTGDVTAFSMGAGEYAAFLVERDGWQQADGALYWTAEHAEVLVAVLAVP